MASLAGCVGAWFLGAALGGVVDRRRGVLIATAALLVALAAMAALFA